MNPNNRIALLAALVMADGKLNWQSDGNTLLAILAELDRPTPKILDHTPKAEYQRHLQDSLIYLDREYGWDMPNLNQQSEEAFYGAFVQLFLTPQGRAWAYAAADALNG